MLSHVYKLASSDRKTHPIQLTQQVKQIEKTKKFEHYMYTLIHIKQFNIKEAEHTID